MDSSTAQTPAPTTAPAAPAATPPAQAPTIPPAQPAGAPVKKSSHIKLLLSVVLLLIMVVGGVFVYQWYANKPKAMYENAYKSAESKPTIAPSPAPTVGEVKSGDTQIDQQNDTIDNSLDELNSDVKNVDKGLQDQSENLN